MLLVFQILEVPSLVEKGSAVVKNQVLKHKEVYKAPHGGRCCS